MIDENQIYSISPEMYIYIMGKFVHLSANFDSPITDILEHYNFAYTNVPHFTDEKEFKILLMKENLTVLNWLFMISLSILLFSCQKQNTHGSLEFRLLNITL